MEEQKKIKIDIGCGENKREGFIGVDIYLGKSVDIVASALSLPFEENSVDEIYSSNLGEHLMPSEMKIFLDEIYRVLKKGGEASLRVDRDFTKKRLLKKDPTHKYRYDAKEIKNLAGKFSKADVKNKFYLFGFLPRNKIFAYFVK